MREIIIENAHENNLKNVSLRIPHCQLIAVTGVSGSGKTSLVNNVLCAEGQRLFFENFIGGRNVSAKLSRPKASLIEGLFPVIAINQNSIIRNRARLWARLRKFMTFCGCFLPGWAPPK